MGLADRSELLLLHEVVETGLGEAGSNRQVRRKAHGSRKRCRTVWYGTTHPNRQASAGVNRIRVVRYHGRLSAGLRDAREGTEGEQTMVPRPSVVPYHGA